MKEKVKLYVSIICGTAITAMAISLFLVPNKKEKMINLAYCEERLNIEGKGMTMVGYQPEQYVKIEL